MADQTSENFTLVSSDNQFSAIWRSTRVQKAAGALYKASGNGATKDTSGVAANDLWGGGVAPLADAYPAGMNALAAWWVGQGATMVKLEMSAVAGPGFAGSMIRGELVTQTGSGATGYFLGYSYSGGIGHAVVDPCTGTFNGIGLVTGSISTATFTPSGVRFFVEEFVFFKNATLQNGIIARQICDTVAEAASRFSALALSAGCTATVAPGMGGVGNAFPAAGSYAISGDVATPTHAPWFGVASSFAFANAQLIAANRTPGALVAADSTWFIGLGNPADGAAGFEWLAHFRCDDQEPADLDPHVSMAPTQVTNNNANVRTLATRSATVMSGNAVVWPQSSVTTNVAWRGWRRRGFPSADAFCTFYPATPAQRPAGASQSTCVITNTSATPQRIACTYASPAELKAFRITLEAQETFAKIEKGTPRALRNIQGISTFASTPDGVFKAISSQQANSYAGFQIGRCNPAVTWTQT